MHVQYSETNAGTRIQGADFLLTADKLAGSH